MDVADLAQPIAASLSMSPAALPVGAVSMGEAWLVVVAWLVWLVDWLIGRLVGWSVGLT